MTVTGVWSSDSLLHQHLHWRNQADAATLILLIIITVFQKKLDVLDIIGTTQISVNPLKIKARKITLFPQEDTQELNFSGKTPKL